MLNRIHSLSLMILPVVLFTPVAVFAAEPEAGSISEQSPEVHWSGGPVTTSNPSGTAGGSTTDCRNPTTRQVDPACDIFHLTVEPPAGKRIGVTITTQPDDTTVISDYDVFVFGPDGELVGDAQTGSGAETVILGNTTAGTFEVVVEAWLVEPGNTFEAWARLDILPAIEPGEEAEVLTSGAYHGTVVPAGSSPSFGSNPNQPVAFARPPLKVEMHPVGRDAAEPTLGVTKTGSAFFAAAAFDGPLDGNPLTHVMRSSDRGRTWENVSPTIPGIDETEPLNTNDPYIFVENDAGRVFSLDMQQLGCFYVIWSDDEGATWDRNPAACDKPGVDHPTLVTGPVPAGLPLVTVGFPEIIYICYNEVADSHCSRSIDGGRTYQVAGEPFPGVNPETGGFCGGLHGHAVTDSEGRLFVPKGQCDVPMVAVSEDAATTFEQSVISSGVQFGSGAHELTIAVDAADNIYAVWWDGEDLLPYLSVSTDHGRTWRDPIMIAPPGVEQVNFPTIDAGDAGRIAIHFPGTTVNDRSDSSRPWNAYEVVSTNALDENPLFVFAVANDPADPIHRGECFTRCAGMFDFLDIVVAPREAGGAFWAAQTDTCTGPCITDSSAAADDAEGMAIVQVGGPMLRLPLPVDVTDRIALVAGNAGFSGGVAHFDMQLRNQSADAVFAPLLAEITALDSSSGNVTAANADNGATQAGARWRYDDQLNGDDRLAADETSGARTLRFNNAAGEPFSVTFRVLSGSEPPQTASGTSSASETSDTTATEPQTLIRLSINPLTGTVAAKVLSGSL